MNRLHEQVGTQLRTFGRCAMMGTLIGLMTTQAFAASAPAATSEPAAAPETTAISTNDSTQTIATAPTANLQLTAATNATTDDTAIPETPSAPEQQANVTEPIDIKAVMDDAAQNTQNLQSTRTTAEKQHQIHPGWLALTAVGGAGIAFATLIFTKGHGSNVAPVGGTIMGVSAGLAGLGLFLTFK
ncbi:MAG TPA: hypothetical protein VMB19_04050 [Silvibacterium sp.]|nr:hypothetical protein [Silvibacterium sp.]